MNKSIAVPSDVLEHWIWQDKPFSRGQAWIDMVLMTDNMKSIINSKVIVLKEGELVTTESKLMERWGWSKSKVRLFLEQLEIENMIIKISDKKKTTITICNYSDYKHYTNQSETTEKPQKNQIKAEGKPEIIAEPTAATNSIANQALFFLDLVNKN